MGTLVLEVSPDLLQDLQAEATRRRETVERVAATLLAECMFSEKEPEETERERVRRALREAGLLSEMGDDLQTRIDYSVRHEDVVAAFNRAGGTPLSEIILSQRGGTT